MIRAAFGLEMGDGQRARGFGIHPAMISHATAGLAAGASLRLGMRRATLAKALRRR
jgi:hypothetical protein